MSCLVRARVCPQIAFCKMLSQFASDFTLDLGGVVGYINQIQRKIWGKVGLHIAGMNLGTRSSARQKFGGDVGASTGTFNGPGP